MCSVGTVQLSKKGHRDHRHDGLKDGFWPTGTPAISCYHAVKARMILSASGSVNSRHSFGIWCFWCRSWRHTAHARAPSRMQGQSLSGSHWHSHCHAAGLSPTCNRHLCAALGTWHFVTRSFFQTSRLLLTSAGSRQFCSTRAGCMCGVLHLEDGMPRPAI